MGTIRILSSKISDRIAAGEVIEGPFSVVRELWDNAVDAGATRVQFALSSGGINLIRVSDNGSGMDRADARVAFLRHATSKIESIDDLLTATSLGFRGEALASIAAVSRTELITWDGSGEPGSIVKVSGGTIDEVADIGAAKGTIVVVRDLFFNTPARKKHLQSAATELARCADVLRARAISRPDVAVTVRHNDKTVFVSSGSGRADVCFAELHGADVLAQLLPVDFKHSDVGVSGVIGAPELNRARRNSQYIIINGRPVQAGQIAAVIEDEFKSLVPLHRYPAFAVYITVRADQVDINVHPAKSEVRLGNIEDVLLAVQSAVKSALKRGAIIVAANRQGDIIGAAAVKEETVELAGGATQQVLSRLSASDDDDDVRGAATQPASACDNDIYDRHDNAGDPDRVALRKLQVVGQLQQSYIVCDSPAGMYVIDQHAAHERVFYDKLMNQDTISPSQVLVRGEIVHVSSAEVELCERYSELLLRSGYDVAPFGSDALRVSAVPAGFELEAALRALEATLARWLQGRSGKPDQQEAAIALAACKASVKAKQKLSGSDMIELVAQLADSENPTRCAHGRPTVIRFDWAAIHRRFGRQ